MQEDKKGSRGPGSNNDALHSGSFVMTTTTRVGKYNFTRNVSWISKRCELKSRNSSKPQLKTMLGIEYTAVSRKIVLHAIVEKPM